MQGGDIKAWIIHRRPYREGSYVVDLLCEQLGRVSAVWRRPKRGFMGEPFTLVSVRLSGKSELKTLSKVEAISRPLPITGNYLYSALYVNELIVKLIKSSEVSQRFFYAYKESLVALSSEQLEAPTLRQFERELFYELGIWPDITQTLAQSDAEWFMIDLNTGIRGRTQKSSTAFSRSELGVVIEDFNHNATRRLHRLFINQLMNGRALNSKALYEAALRK